MKLVISGINWSFFSFVIGRFREFFFCEGIFFVDKDLEGEIIWLIFVYLDESWVGFGLGGRVFFRGMYIVAF